RRAALQAAGAAEVEGDLLGEIPARAQAPEVRIAFPEALRDERPGRKRRPLGRYARAAQVGRASEEVAPGVEMHGQGLAGLPGEGNHHRAADVARRALLPCGVALESDAQATDERPRPLDARPARSLAGPFGEAHAVQVQPELDGPDAARGPQVE